LINLIKIFETVHLKQGSHLICKIGQIKGFLCYFLFAYLFWNRVLLGSRGWPWTLNPPASAWQVLGWQACTITTKGKKRVWSTTWYLRRKSHKTQNLFILRWTRSLLIITGYRDQCGNKHGRALITVTRPQCFHPTSTWLPYPTKARKAPRRGSLPSQLRRNL
jgi:hypothetical protein